MKELLPLNTIIKAIALGHPHMADIILSSYTDIKLESAIMGTTYDPDLTNTLGMKPVSVIHGVDMGSLEVTLLGEDTRLYSMSLRGHKKSIFTEAEATELITKTEALIKMEQEHNLPSNDDKKLLPMQIVKKLFNTGACPDIIDVCFDKMYIVPYIGTPWLIEDYKAFSGEISEVDVVGFTHETVCNNTPSDLTVHYNHAGESFCLLCIGFNQVTSSMYARALLAVRHTD